MVGDWWLAYSALGFSSALMVYVNPSVCLKLFVREVT